MADVEEGVVLPDASYVAGTQTVNVSMDQKVENFRINIIADQIIDLFIDPKIGGTIRTNVTTINVPANTATTWQFDSVRWNEFDIRIVFTATTTAAIDIDRDI